MSKPRQAAANLKRLIQPLPQWALVGASEIPDVQLTLIEPAGSRSVTGDCVIVSLRPFLVAIAASLSGAEKATLQFHQRNHLVGELMLSKVSREDEITVYRPRENRDYCLSPTHRVRDSLLQGFAQLRNRSSQQISLADYFSMNIFYIKPRPVVLVCVSHGELFNVFPMDLIGPIGTQFTLALHKTSKARELMASAGTVLLCDPPIEKRSIVYDMAANHRQDHVDIDALPFALHHRNSWGYPEFTLATRAVEIVNIREIGSHLVHIGRVVDECTHADGDQLHHCSGRYQYYVNGQQTRDKLS